MTMHKYLVPLFMALAIAGCNQSSQDTSSNDGNSNESSTGGDIETPSTDLDDSLNSDTTDNDTTASDELTTGSDDKPAVTHTYKVLLDASYPPFAFEDIDGNIKGFDLDVLQAAGEAAGFKPDFSTDYWDGIFTKLDDGSTDIIASGIPITPQRSSEALFSDPYITENIVITYNSPDPKTFEQLAEGMIAVEMGSPLLTTLHDLNVNEDNIIEYPSSFDAMPDVLSGEVDGLIDDKAIIQYQLESMDNTADVSQIKTVDLPNSQDGNRAFAIKQGRTDVADKVNEGLATIKKNGQYDVIYKKWFGMTPSE